jgi:hypothetical protein
MLVALRTAQDENMFIAPVIVMGHLSTRLITQQSSRRSIPFTVQAINFHTGAKRFPGQGVSAIAQRPEVGDDERRGRQGSVRV